MKLRNLIITGILMTTMIFAGCGGKSETAKVTKEKSPEIQAAWNDILGEDEEGNIYSITEEIHGDILSCDCSYNNLELSMGKEKDLFEIWNRFKEYYLFLQKQLGQYHYTLTGMG